MIEKFNSKPPWHSIGFEKWAGAPKINLGDEFYLVGDNFTLYYFKK